MSGETTPYSGDDSSGPAIDNDYDLITDAADIGETDLIRIPMEQLADNIKIIEGRLSTEEAIGTEARLTALEAVVTGAVSKTRYRSGKPIHVGDGGERWIVDTTGRCSYTVAACNTTVAHLLLLPLEVPDGVTLTGVSVYCLPKVGAHGGGLPATMPKMKLIRVAQSAPAGTGEITETATTLHTVTDATSLANYELRHALNGTGWSDVIDLDTYSYHLLLETEADASLAADTFRFYHDYKVTFTTAALDKGAS